MSMPIRRATSVSLFAILVALLAPASPAAAQPAQARVTVRVLLEDAPVEGAQVAAAPASAVTDAAGRAVLRLAPGPHVLRVEGLGIATTERAITVRADTAFDIAVEGEAVEHEEIIVSSTRADRRIEDEPIRVEVVVREEIEEKLLMTPGDIAMLLNETAGLRVQPTAPSLGGASVRIQGLRGRYTQILSDGLPLFGGQTGALGPLQIPPMDLDQVEVIKGAASALYGASALGGVINLISRRPQEARERELLLNQSTSGGSDAILWASQQLSDDWGYTLLASGHRQGGSDVDDDGWADLPAFRRVVARPRLFWGDGTGASVLFTVGGMLEGREGGTIDGGRTPAGTSHIDAVDTRRADAGLIGRFPVAQALLVSVRGSGTVQGHQHRFGESREEDRHATLFAEATLAGTAGSHTWLAGAALQHERYSAFDVAGFDYRFTIPALFVQDEFAASERFTASASARLDHHSEYGTFLNPRLSILVRPADEWTVRASAGTGYFAPTPWVDETEAVGLRRLQGWRGLDAERVRSASLDIGRAFGGFEINATAFASHVRDAIQARPAAADPARIEIINADGPVRTWGTELLARYHVEGIHVTATHVWLRSTQPDPRTGEREEVPLNPRHAFGLVAAYEVEGEGRIGVELYFTGRQTLDDNPYRTESPRHVITGFLAERRFGSVRVFLNAENLLDTRQTRHDPLTLPARAPDGRWITDAWGPLEGRAFNGGVRWFF